MRRIKGRKELEAILKKRSLLSPGLEKKVRGIISAVKKDGDSALFDLTEKYDGARLKDFRVKEEEIKRASLALDKSLKRTIALAKKRIEEFHKKEKTAGFLLKKRYGYVKKVFTPIETVGIYIPAGTSPLISTVLMTVIPAKIAGVKKIILVSPPKENGKINPYILATAGLCGIKEIYKIGGAQAIAALALGTETIPKVDKIVGPGNRYVTTAKRLLFGDVDIDLLAGPSEVVILADETAKTSFVETDLSAQSEHTGGLAILITNSRTLVKRAEKNVKNGYSILVKEER